MAVVGGGNSALDATLQLVRIARHVYVVNIAANLSGDAIMRQKAQESKMVTLLNNTQVTAVLGERVVNGIKIKKENKEEILSVEGVFVEAGLIPNSEFAKDIEKNQLGEIKINHYNETSAPAIFAAGDVTDVSDKQIIIAAGEGAKACLSAFRYLIQSKA